MVQNQVTILGWNGPNGAFRQLDHWRKAKKVRMSSMISQYHPPPPTQTVGGGGRISGEICRFFAFRAIIWRRGSIYPRKMQVLVSSSRHLAAGLLRSEVPPDWCRFCTMPQ